MSTQVLAARAKRRPARPRAQWPAPTGLILLSALPVIIGATRLTELGGGPQVIPQDALDSHSPIPLITHIVAGTVFSILGALQFVPALRLRGRSWHRIVGRALLVPAGLLAALSALWLTLFYRDPTGAGDLLVGIRVLFGSGMVTALVLGLLAVRRRQFVLHSEWMTRAYAIGVGAGTQVFFLIPGSILFGSTHQLSRALLMAAAWVANLAVAELVIRRRRAGLRHPASV